MGRTARNYPKGKLKLRTPKELQPGKRYPVYIEYNWQADSMRKTTEVTVFSKDWNEKGYGGIGEIRTTTDLDYKYYNNVLHKRLADIDAKIVLYYEKNGHITGDVIRAFLDENFELLRPDSGKDFVEFANELVKSKYDKGKIGLALSIPIAANLGGIGTPIGTPPNATAVKFLAEAGADVTFGEWAIRMIPFVIIMLLVAWAILQLFFPFKAKEIKLEIPENKRKSDWKTTVVWITFVGTILLWATEQWTKINSNVVALIPLGVLTACGIFTKEDIKEINWSVLWLVAGGFALGTCLQGTGLAKVLIQAIPFGSMSVILVLLVAGLVCYFLSNFISNSATAALLIPILIVVAEGMADPAAANNASFVALGGTQAMISFIAVCASIAMLFPISTPPNAIASSTGLVETKDMAKVGIIIGAVGFILGYFWLTKLFPFA